MNTQEIVNIVQESLDKAQPERYRVDVQPGDVRQDGRWWYVVVKPSDPDIRSFEFNQILRSVEETIEDENKLHVLLVPALVD